VSRELWSGVEEGRERTVVELVAGVRHSEGGPDGLDRAGAGGADDDTEVVGGSDGAGFGGEAFEDGDTVVDGGESLEAEVELCSSGSGVVKGAAELGANAVLKSAERRGLASFHSFQRVRCLRASFSEAGEVVIGESGEGGMTLNLGLQPTRCAQQAPVQRS